MTQNISNWSNFFYRGLAYKTNAFQVLVHLDGTI